MDIIVNASRSPSLCTRASAQYTPSVRPSLVQEPQKELPMPLRLAMLGMWHTHADGIVRQIVEHPKEFTLAGFYDRDPQLVARRRKAWEPRLGNLRVFDKPEALVQERF